MTLFDSIRLAQTNLRRSKLRTFLTIIAIFIGALTISLTNGVSNGARAYFNEQLGAMGAANSLIIQPKVDEGAQIGDTNIAEYNPDSTTGAFNIPTLSQNDIDKISKLKDIQSVTPDIMLKIDYVTTGDKDKKYTLTATQFTEGLNLPLEAGRIVNTSSDNEVTIPKEYLQPLGFKSANDSLGKLVVFGFTDAQNITHEQEVKIVGVLKPSLLARGGWYISPTLAKAIHATQTSGVASLQNSYMSATAYFNKNLSEEQVDSLKDRLSKAGYVGMTTADVLGRINQALDAIQIGLNIFGAIALLAASFGIVNTLLMAVNERTREIGLMKALGASRQSIFGIFSLEAISLGFWGALLGVLASMGIGAIANPIASNTFLKDFEGFNLLAFPILPSLGIIGLIMLIAFIAGALPSLKASRLNPIDALRYE